jgi:hypothetical protein
VSGPRKLGQASHHGAASSASSTIASDAGLDGAAFYAGTRWCGAGDGVASRR